MAAANPSLPAMDADPCPLVTIAIPTRNRAAMLARAAASALNQTYPRIEVIVSDNASEDDTPRELERLAGEGARVIRQQSNLGMVGNWNALLAQAKGEFFVNLSDDDYLEPEFAAHLARELKGDQEASFAYAAVTFHDEVTGATWQPSFAPFVEDGQQTVLQSFAGRRTVLPSFTMIRTADLRAMGGYSEKLGIGADWAAWLPLAMRGRVRQPLLRLGNYTQHADNLSNRSEDLVGALLGIARLSDEESVKARFPEEIQAALREAGRRWIAQQTAYILAKQIQLGRSRADVWAETRRHFGHLLGDPFRAFALLLAFFVLPRGAHSRMRSAYRFVTSRMSGVPRRNAIARAV
jgi:glycosyltransferase involved in cell wall biosynthesis